MVFVELRGVPSLPPGAFMCSSKGGLLLAMEVLPSTAWLTVFGEPPVGH
jgi:hypothetical protein